LLPACSWDLSGSIMDRALLHLDCVYKVRAVPGHTVTL
jgi:xanthine dehydrogenase molybdopterin-binding subunit B